MNAKLRSGAGGLIALLLMAVGLLGHPRSKVWTEDLAADRRFERSLVVREAAVVLLIAALFVARLLLS